MSKLFQSCEEATHTCDKAQYDDASFWEKIKLNIHLIYCAACRKYTKKNTKLTKLFQQNPVTLSSDDKESIKTTFEKELQKHQY